MLFIRFYKDTQRTKVAQDWHLSPLKIQWKEKSCRCCSCHSCSWGKGCWRGWYWRGWCWRGWCWLFPSKLLPNWWRAVQIDLLLADVRPIQKFDPLTWVGSAFVPTPGGLWSGNFQIWKILPLDGGAALVPQIPPTKSEDFDQKSFSWKLGQKPGECQQEFPSVSQPALQLRSQSPAAKQPCLTKPSAKHDKMKNTIVICFIDLLVRLEAVPSVPILRENGKPRHLSLLIRF